MSSVSDLKGSLSEGMGLILGAGAVMFFLFPVDWVRLADNLNDTRMNASWPLGPITSAMNWTGQVRDLRFLSSGDLLLLLYFGLALLALGFVYWAAYDYVSLANQGLLWVLKWVARHTGLTRLYVKAKGLWARLKAMLKQKEKPKPKPPRNLESEEEGLFYIWLKQLRLLYFDPAYRSFGFGHFLIIGAMWAGEVSLVGWSVISFGSTKFWGVSTLLLALVLVCWVAERHLRFQVSLWTDQTRALFLRMLDDPAQRSKLVEGLLSGAKVQSAGKDVGEE
ncbi:MAG: hypothetical protein ABSG92_10725 [Conexivisphaerales archaeon]|jgi:hypothetical protein